MAGPPESLTLRQRLDDQATQTEPAPPIRNDVGEGTVQPTLERSPSPTPPITPEPPEDPRFIFDEFLAGHRASMAQSRAADYARRARDAEIGGDMSRRDALMGKAHEELQRAEAVGPSVKSYKEVDTVGRAVRYALGLTGQSALSVTASIGAGAAGRVGTTLARRALGVRRAANQIDAAGAFAGASGALYGDIRGGTIIAQESDPTIREQPVEARERASLATTAGSTALEALVPAAIGSRVGRRALARNKLTAADVSGRVSGKGRLGHDMFAEGMTEVSQEHLEQFALHLQNPEQAKFASTEEGINAFFAGLAGGAFGHGVGRGMEKGVDFASRVRPGLDSSPGMFGSLRLDPKASALDVVLREDDATRPAIKVIDEINRQLTKENIGVNHKNFVKRLNELIFEKASGPARNRIFAITRMFFGLKNADSYQDARKGLIKSFRDEGVANPEQLVETLEERLAEVEGRFETGGPRDIFESDKTDTQLEMDRTVEGLGLINDDQGNPIEGYDNLKLLDGSTELNIDDFHFVFNAPEGGRTTERHSPIDQPETQSISMPAYRPNPGQEPFQIRNLIKNMNRSPFSARLTDPYRVPDEETGTNPYVRDADGNPITFDHERADYVSYDKYLDAANISYGASEQDHYINTAKALIEELSGRNRSNTDEQRWVRDQHDAQIQELAQAIQMEYENSSNDGRALNKGVYEGKKHQLSLKQLFKQKYVVGVIRKQEIADMDEAGIRATKRDMHEFQRGIDQITGEKSRKTSAERAIPILQKVPWAENQLRQDPSPYRVVWVDPNSVRLHAAKNWRLRQNDKKAPTRHQLISEGLTSILNMPETVGILETDENNNILQGDPNLVEAQQFEDEKGGVRTAIPDVRLKAGKNQEFGTVFVTDKPGSRQITPKKAEGFYSADTESAQQYWMDTFNQLANDSDAQQYLELQLQNDLAAIAEESGLPQIAQLAKEAGSQEGNFRQWLNNRVTQLLSRDNNSLVQSSEQSLDDAQDLLSRYQGEDAYKSLSDLRTTAEAIIKDQIDQGQDPEQFDILNTLTQIENAQTALQKRLLAIKSERQGEIYPDGTKKDKSSRPGQQDDLVLKIRERTIRGILGQLTAVRAGLDQRLNEDYQASMAYYDKDTSMEQLEAQTVYEKEFFPDRPEKVNVNLETGEVTLPVPKEPTLPEFTKAGVKKMYAAVTRAMQLANAVATKTFDKTASEMEHFLSRHAFGFITDQEGAAGVNVSALRDMNPAHAVLVLLNSMDSARAIKQLEAAAESQGSIVLSQQSQVDRDAFDTKMAELEYARHPGYPNVYITTAPLRMHRRNSTWAAELAQYQKEVKEFTEALEANREAEARMEFIQQILWRANVWYNGPSRVDEEGKSPFNVSLAARKWLKKEGFELTRVGNRVRLKPVKSGKEKKEGQEKKETPTTKAEKQRKSKQAREVFKEQLKESLATQFAKSQEELAQAMEVVSDWTTRKARETLADFFNGRGQTDSERRMMRDLEKSLFKNKRVRAQILNHLQNADTRSAFDINEKEFSRIQSNEGSYYAFAFQLATANMINLSPASDQWFKRIIEYLAGLLNIHMAHFFGESMFTAIRNGDLTNRNDIRQVYQDVSGELDQTLENIAKVTRKGINRLMTAAPDVLRQYGAEGRKLADLFAVPEASGQSTKTHGFIPRRRHQNDAWLNKLKRKVLDRYTDAELEQGWLEYRIGDTTSAAAQAIDSYVNEVYRYMQRQGVMLTNFRGGKFKSESAIRRDWKVPMAFNIDAVTEGRLDLQKLFTKHGLDAQQASELVDSILWAGGNFSLVENEFDQDHNPTNVGTLSGLLQVIDASNAHEFAPYLTNDGDAALLKFTRQAVHKAEFTKSFGHNGATISKTLNKLRAQGLNRSELKYIEDRVIPAMVGTLTYKMHPKWRQAVGTMITIQNMAILPLMIFPAMVDMWGISMVTGDMKDGWRAFKSGMREIRRSFADNPDASTELAEILGIITDHSLLDRVGDTYNEMMDVSLLRKMNQKFFYATGIEQWTKGIRMASMHAGIKYIIENRNNADKLGPLGLEVGDVKLDSDGNLVGLGTDEALSTAINRFVDSTVLRPSAAHRPAWGSDPRWLLVWHLKQFTFTFHKVFLNRFITEARQGNPNYMMMLPFLMMVPTMMVSDSVKNIIAPSAYFENMSFTESIQHAVSRSSVLGVGTFGLDAMRDVEFGKIPGSSLIGPTADSAYRFYDKGFFEGLFRLTPGYALWTRWLN